MRPRHALAAALLAATAAVVPYNAAVAYAASPVMSPDCVATLQNAASGISSSCSTQGPPPVACNGCGVRRSVEVVVTTGRADATLVCDGLTYATHVDGPGTGSTGAWGGQNCTLTLTAMPTAPSAAAASASGWVVVRTDHDDTVVGKHASAVAVCPDVEEPVRRGWAADLVFAAGQPNPVRRVLPARARGT